MIERYTRPEMGILWDQDHKFGKMMEVEMAVAEVQASMGIIPRSAARLIRQKGRFSVKRITEIEKQTKHDVIAFVSSMAENIGPAGKYVHYGMTSSDVLDTAFSLQVREAGTVLLASVLRLEKSLRKLSRENAETLCAGRTHGMFAEPTTFGYKMAGFLAEHLRNKKRLQTALEQMAVCKLSGAVGTYSSQPAKVEDKVARKLKLKRETIATQVIPRDRHAELITAIAILGAGLERLAIELRHLQRSEVGEVTEGFTKGQKGSSAMPHKKNPISAENITGASRLLRSYALSALENVALWHERDISHSSVERVIFPDTFILADYAVHRMSILLDGLQVNKKKMIENIESSQGQLYSSHVLLALVQKGMSRETAYANVQRLCHSMGYGDHLKRKIKEDPEVGKLLKPKELEEIFTGKNIRKPSKGDCMKLSEPIYEGKAKRIYALPEEPNHWLIEYKDSLTAFNALKKGSFADKGSINRDITSLIFQYLRKNQVPNHWVRDMEANFSVVEKVQIIPLEVVVRNTLAGSTAKKTGD